MVTLCRCLVPGKGEALRQTQVHTVLIQLSSVFPERECFGKWEGEKDDKTRSKAVEGERQRSRAAAALDFASVLWLGDRHTSQHVRLFPSSKRDNIYPKELTAPEGK